MQKLNMLKKRLKSTTVLLCKTLEKPVKQICFSRLSGEDRIHCSVMNYVAYSSLQRIIVLQTWKRCSKQA